jgi:hypothetical protein
MKAMYSVWEAEVNGDPGAYLVAMSACREASLREEIAAGERLMRLLRLVLLTDDRNEARQMASCEM